MEKIVFKKKMNELLSEINIEINENKIDMFYLYMQELLEWNKKINLTAIEDENEIILKHFIDSLTVQKYIKNAQNIIDIGTGAGFPGIPLAIVNEKSNIVLLDSLNKRINFLNNVIQKLELSNVKAIHGRAEDLAKIVQHREKYDIVISRAVAPFNVLLEYMLPFNKVNSYTIAMKGSNIEEVDISNNALKKLGGKIEKIEKINLPNTDIKRNIIIVRKIEETPKKFPRKAGIPKKEPL
ncbi:MAG: 16S rRNA (guanine(527)-N(7))-methyltransferase RsmG [Clostridia bacterium]|jgi:16S rRNA (guanine527-N7)-methyltransferase|nr:ribosomal RNA small subunit methyltransferase G [Clostridium sp. CAG:571]HJJ13889.1 16S rRNA (guanine(527)-N(7))-methyltransferase RsmG [Clostridiaceae bacterium]